MTPGNDSVIPAPSVYRLFLYHIDVRETQSPFSITVTPVDTVVRYTGVHNDTGCTIKCDDRATICVVGQPVELLMVT